jgi:hypothetical protein
MSAPVNDGRGARRNREGAIRGAHAGSGPLLSVALTVDQLDGGEFHWLLLESFDHSMEFEQLTASAVCYGTYVEALEAGFEVLKAMSPDPRVGPREIDDHPDND